MVSKLQAKLCQNFKSWFQNPYTKLENLKSVSQNPCSKFQISNWWLGAVANSSLRSNFVSRHRNSNSATPIWSECLGAKNCFRFLKFFLNLTEIWFRTRSSRRTTAAREAWTRRWLPPAAATPRAMWQRRPNCAIWPLRTPAQRWTWLPRVY